MGRVNRSSSALQQIGYLVGLWIGAVCLNKLAPYVVIFMDGLTFLVAGFLVLIIQPLNEYKLKDRSGNYLRSFFDELKTLSNFKNENMLVFHLAVTIALITIIIDLYNVFLFKLVSQRFNNESFFISTFESIFALAVVLASYLGINKLFNSFFRSKLDLIFALLLGLQSTQLCPWIANHHNGQLLCLVIQMQVRNLSLTHR